MKRILIFSLAYYPHVGGAEVAVKEITDRINKEDIEFHMVTLRFSPDEKKEETVGNVRVFRIGRGGHRTLDKFAFQFFAFLKAQRLHKKYHYDAVWALMAHSSGIPAGLFKSFNREVFYLLNLQEGDPPFQIERTMWPLWPLFVHAFKVADVVQPLSHFLAAWARRRGFAGPIEVIPNGADIAHFEGAMIPHDGVVLITTSRLVHKNAVDDVIRALPLLPPEVCFKILGTGPDESKLRKLAREMKVESRVSFVGYVDHKDMPKHLHAADIFVRPSRSEGQGASFIEAMAAGLPVIASQEGGIADFLFDAKKNPEHEPTGFAVSKDSPQEIAEVVSYMLAHPDAVRMAVENAKKFVRGRYDWSTIAHDMRSRVFDRVLENG